MLIPIVCCFQFGISGVRLRSGDDVIELYPVGYTPEQRLNSHSIVSIP